MKEKKEYIFTKKLLAKHIKINGKKYNVKRFDGGRDLDNDMSALWDYYMTVINMRNQIEDDLDLKQPMYTIISDRETYDAATMGNNLHNVVIDIENIEGKNFQEEIKKKKITVVCNERLYIENLYWVEKWIPDDTIKEDPDDHYLIVIGKEYPYGMITGNLTLDY